MAFYDKFPYTNFQELNLDWITQEVSKVRDNRDATDASAAAALASEQAAKASENAAAASQQAAANSETAAAGSEAASADYLAQIGTHTAGAVADWLKENLQPTTPPLDESLTVSGAAADAKTTGDAITATNTELKSQLMQNIRKLDDGKRIFEMVWGNIAPDGTINYNYTPRTRVVNYTYEKFDKNTVLSLATGYGLILALYDDSYALISRTIYAGGNVITVPANTYFRVCVYHGTIVPSSIVDLADKVTYTSGIQTEIEAALTSALAITNGGVGLTVVDDLNTAAASVMSGDGRAAFFRYTSSTLNIPNNSSGFVIIYRAGTLYQTQIAMPTTGGLFARNRLNSVWNTWRRIDSSPRVYHVEKDGTGDFTSLVDAINDATQYMDSKIYVGAGTWDICDELGETYLNEVSSKKRGVYLKNRVHLIFASNSKVVCNYTGAREDTMTWLSAFNAGQYGFTLENANIECSNVRYCVHDERDSESESYVNKYINCKMYLNNSSNTVIRTCNPIGGGLGKNGYIDINGCWFKGEPTQVYVSQLPLVTYHNSASADAKSHISVKNCYLHGDGRFRFNWYGQSQLITDVEVSGCSMGSSILSQAEVSGSSPYENISIIEWNNIIRS